MINRTDIKILVVDDDHNLLELLTDTLISIEYNAVGVDSGAKALEKLNSEKFDMVISDIKMPEMDGLTLLSKIRENYPTLPFLFITGVDSPEIIAQATPNGLLVKPFRISNMEQMIEDALAGKTTGLKKAIRNILLVDDDETYLAMMGEVFGRKNYSLLLASNAQEAMDHLSISVVDAVITDIKMPEMDGFELTQTVKKKFPSIPVILVTAFSDIDKLEEQIKESKADGFFEKTNKIENLVELVSSL